MHSFLQECSVDELPKIRGSKVKSDILPYSYAYIPVCEVKSKMHTYTQSIVDFRSRGRLKAVAHFRSTI